MSGNLKLDSQDGTDLIKSGGLAISGAALVSVAMELWPGFTTWATSHVQTVTLITAGATWLINLLRKFILKQ